MKKLFFYLPGLRAMKTGIAVMLCVIVADLLGIEYPFYAMIAAVITMGATITNSYKVGKNRMIGTAVGAIIGIVFSMIAHANPILCGIGIVLTIYICSVFCMNEATVIASIVFIAIMINLDNVTPFFYGMNRILDTLLGIGIALVVNVLIFPPNHYKHIIGQEKKLNNKMHKQMENLLVGEVDTEERMKQECLGLLAEMKVYFKEFKLYPHNDKVMISLKEDVENYEKIADELIILNRFDHYNMNKQNEQAEITLENHPFFAAETEAKAKEEQFVYNFHVKRMGKMWEEVCKKKTEERTKEK